jgi:hypothetical protein
MSFISFNSIVVISLSEYAVKNLTQENTSVFYLPLVYSDFT